MEFWKNGLSETSSEENDKAEKVKDEKSTARRSYECTYCKRGFTNAQALGGHMNIHRKDRAKAKQVTASSPSIKRHDDDDDDQDIYTAYKDFTPFSTQPTQRNHPTYFRPSDSSPRYPHADHEQRLGANLSLQIGPTNQGYGGIERNYGKDDEVDLELRLGYYP